MRTLFTASLTAALLSAPYAHAQNAATLDDIVVVGASDLLSNFLKASLSEQSGTPLSNINLRAVELEAVNTGFFKSVGAQLATENGKNLLRLTVVPNGNITTVTVTGASFISGDQIKGAFEERLNIAPGTTLNTARVEESKTLLQQSYRDLGFPFAPKVSVEIRETPQGAAVNYTVNESAAVRRVEVTGNTQLPAGVIEDAFRPIVQNKSFTNDLYRAAITAVGEAYAARGLQGSGVNAQASSIENGVFKVAIRELKVGTVDTGALGNVSIPLQVKPGALLNVNVVGQDVRALSNAAGKSVVVDYQADPQNSGAVNVVYSIANVQTGPIREVRIAGATAVPVTDLSKVLKVRVGDVYTPQLAVEDYTALQRVYRERGFELSTRDPIKFENGVLTYTVREVKIGGYDLKFEGGQVTRDRVILRELPEPGTVFNVNVLREDIGNLVRTGLVTITAEPQTRPDPKNPESLIFVLSLSERRTGTFTPSISYDTASGFSGELGLGGNNLFGLGYSYNVGLTGQQNDVGESLGASASFTIPWLDINFLDFRRVRTSLGFQASSSVAGNNPIIRASPGNPATTENTGRQYTQRSTGFGVSVGRPITDNLRLSVGVNTQYNSSRLEPIKAGDSPTPPTVDEATAQSLVPKPGLTTFLSTGLGYDSANNLDFPTAGVRASASAGYGFGYQGDVGLSWTQYTGGARSYLGFGGTTPDGNKRQAFAIRADGGSIVGNAPASSLFLVGGGSTTDAFTLRGYDPSTFIGKNFFTSSAEYRYNFGVNASFLQGLYGVAFVDAGDAWNSGRDFNVNFGYGLGVQVNLGIGGGLLPALRFDYAFSPANSSGKFSFRLGGFF